ncbi:MAG: carbohydrate kinase family protein [Bryobacterales bacterium]|nr:carbohydrate kinase family protein [Bryobacterales bacterium]
MAVTGVLCSGSIVMDVLVRSEGDAPWGTTTFVDTLEFHVGGNGANTALALAAMETPVRLAGCLGDDEQSRFVLRRLHDAGVDTRAVTQLEAPTASTVVMVNSAGQRKFLHRLGASARAFAEPLIFTSQLMEGMTHYHLASLFVLPHMREQGPEMLRRARAAGCSTSLDTNWDPNGLWMKTVAPCLPYLDFVFMNEDEARMITGLAEPEPAARVLLGEGVRTAVMKLGGRGCAIYTADEEIVSPAFPVEVRDTTGAGDSFVGGFLAARARGANLTQAARFANAVAAHSVQHIGAVAGIPAYQEIVDWLAVR